MMLYKLLRRGVRLSYPWFSLVISLWGILYSTGRHRQRSEIRFWRLYSRIDFAKWLAIAYDLIQPEFWI